MTQIQSSEVIQQGLSVIIPTFNGSVWLEKTIDEIEKSIKKAKLEKFEIIVINDGSTDDTVEVVEQVAKKTKLPLRFHTQPNSGRFVARRTGTKQARYPYLLFVDTRVFIGEESLLYVIGQHAKDPTRAVWCSHVRVETAGNIYARFWEAIAYVAWRGYFSNPRDISYGINEFDKYPKGTTCFFIKRSILTKANDWFVKNTNDLRDSNDDTLLIRHIAKSNSINISPNFWCLYHARSVFPQYIKHSFHRGKVFVDGFLRNDGNVFFWPLILFIVLTAALPIFLIIQPWLMLQILMAGLVVWILELLALILLRVPIKDSISLWVLSPVFAIVYGLGIWTAIIRVHIIKRLNK